MEASFVVGIALGLVCWSAVVSAGRGAEDAGAVQRHGQLRVIGTKLCDDRGRPVQLRGMSTHGLQWYGWGSKLTGEALDVLAREWRADILRVSMYVDEGGYRSDPARFTRMVDTLVDEALGRGMYCVIDFHQLRPGDPMARIDEARAFFAHVSKEHGGKKYVLYEICNEPNGREVNWERIKTYAEKIIPIIRGNDPEGIIIVGTPAWSSLGMSGGPSGRAILEDPLAGEMGHNVMYAFHFYAASHGERHRREFPEYAERLPIFVTEWGSQEASGDGRNDFESARAWMELLDEYQISWINWNYSDDRRSGAVWERGTMPEGPFTDDRLKEAGRFVKALISERETKGR